ncbi:MAG: PhnD/SsuA/transferrin family substrate-binding protein [Hansschlegelia sp.]
MTAFATLPMYAAPPEALAAFWDGVRSRLAAGGVAEAQAALVQSRDLLADWRSHDLLFGQTCGSPFSTVLRDEVVLVGVPHYAAPGCEGPLYRSLLVVREDDPAEATADLVGRRAAINGFESHSGFSQLVATLAPFANGRRVIGETVVSGAHLRSLALLREGVADVAAIDCVTWALAARDDPGAIEGLRIIGHSQPSLGLPFIASRRFGAEAIDALRGALVVAVRDPALEAARAGLMLTGVSFPTPNAYRGHAEAAQAARRALESSQGPLPTTGQRLERRSGRG